MPDDLKIPDGYVLVPREVYELLVRAAGPVTITHFHFDEECPPYTAKTYTERKARTAD